MTKTLHNKLLAAARAYRAQHETITRDTPDYDTYKSICIQIAEYNDINIKHSWKKLNDFLDNKEEVSTDDFLSKYS